MAGDGLAARAQSIGMPGVNVDGNDVLAVYEATRKAVERARDGEGPTTIVCHTFRYGGHHVGDPGTSYRSKDEIDEWRGKDPILHFEKILVNHGVISPEQIETMREDVELRIQDAVKTGREAPFPDVSEVTEHVFA